MFLDYAGLRVQELDRSIEFYTKGAELEELGRGTMGHGGVWVLLWDRTSCQRLELNWYPAGSKFHTPYAAGEGLDHLGFRVADLEAAVKRFEGAGGHVVERVTEGEGPGLVYLTDPDGNWIELIPTEMH